MRNMWIWQTINMAEEHTAKDFVYFENRSGEEYKKKKYKAYYEKAEDGYTVYYAEKFKVLSVTYRVVGFRDDEHTYTRAYMGAGYTSEKYARERIETLRKYGNYKAFEIIKEAHIESYQWKDYDKYIEMEVKAV